MILVTSRLRVTVISNLACDNIAARTRLGLLTCVIHELTDLPTVRYDLQVENDFPVDFSEQVH